MGLIAISTPCGLERRQTTKTILRLKKVKSSELVAGRGIPIRSYVLPLKDPLTQLKFKPVMQLIRPCIIQKSISLSLTWHAMDMSRSMLERRPNWSGFMQSVSEGTHPLPSETLFLPIIDLKSTDESCIYSTLTFIQEQASRLNLVTPCITFDQPLWIKAVKIIMSKNLNIVCRLGGFHMLMSFIGSIGSLMDGSGIAELLETSYGPNSVNQMLSGKAVSRALRGYFLADAALNVKLLQTVTNVGNETEEMLTEDEVDEAAGISDEVPAASADLSPGLVSSPKGYPYNEQSRTPCSTFSMTEDAVSEMQRLVLGFQNGTVTLNQILESDELNLLSQTLVSIKSYLEKISRTSKLWL